ncbi:DUF952 domain-containing protein [Oerskovia sp. NPDC056781]|uniref:DUF952 domain-containing protein n=1 Tax=Oerskovia sp. NPDC056781 TaxID=3345942 RepID=UPI00366F0D59
MGGHRVLHVAFSDDWEACERFGEYDVATRNTLYEVEGFVHATTLAGLPSVLDGRYADASIPLVLAVIDEDSLADEGIEVAWEPQDGAPGGLAPRILGAFPMDGRTVAAVVELDRVDDRWVVPDLSGLSVRP